MNSKDYRQKRKETGNPIVDKRKGDRHSSTYVRKVKPVNKTKWQRRVVVAWDGEGKQNAKEVHIYNLLANSNGHTLHTSVDTGLGTKQCLDFMLENSNPLDINVIFAGNYDVNMILKDIDKERLTMLWTTGKCYWQGYRIGYIPNKKFTISRINGSGKTFTLWDVFGFYQTSFVKACLNWRVGTVDELVAMDEMKLKRSEFSEVDIQSIIEYNKKECQFLVELIGKLFDALDTCGLSLTRYDGAGAIATAMLKKENVREHMGDIPEEVTEYAQYAFSGGRIEMIKMGHTPNQTSIFNDDINSAYPAACLSLPSYKDATWSLDKEWNGKDYSLVMVEYEFEEGLPFYPFFYRRSNNSIVYPRKGVGIYYGVEVRAALEVVHMDGDEKGEPVFEEGIDFKIIEAYNCTINNDTKPFAFVQDYYNQRQEFIKENNHAQYSIKLGINSLYGKTVQQKGYRGGKIPATFQLLWGGQITAYCRAQMFRAAMLAPHDIVAFSTDGLLSLKKLPLPHSKLLGEWDHKEYNGCTIVQSGVYWLDDGDTVKEKYRGFKKDSIIRSEIIKAWRNNEVAYEAKVERFVTLGAALASKDFGIWRQWLDKPRKLSLVLSPGSDSGKRLHTPNQYDFANGLMRTEAAYVTPEAEPNNPELSKVYDVMWLNGRTLSDREIDDKELEMLEELIYK